MGYNDPVGDEHEQSSLLAGRASNKLNEAFTELFGSGSIKHSDFRTGYITGITVKRLGFEDLEAYVDSYPDLVADFQDNHNGRTKSEYGRDHWDDYWVLRSTGKTIDERVMVYDRSEVIGTWTLPAEGASTNKPSPIEATLAFGDTIEFEIQYSGSGDKFDSYRRYMSSNYEWRMQRAKGDISPPIPVTTSRGMVGGAFGFQSRYMFNTPTFTGEQKWLVGVKPTDLFNNHDNMGEEHTFCVLTVSPITDVEQDLAITEPDGTVNVNQVYCGTGETRDVKIVNNISGLVSGKRGTVVLDYSSTYPTATTDEYDHSFSSESIFAPSRIQPNAVPQSGEMVYSVECDMTVSGNTYGQLWSYTLRSPAVPITVVRAPDVDSDNVLGSHIGTSLEDPTGKVYKHFDQLSPSVNPGIGSGVDIKSPSYLLDGSDPYHYWNPAARTALSVENSIEYYESEWEELYGFNNTGNISGTQYDWCDRVQIGTGFAYPRSCAFRVSRNVTANGVPSACGSKSDIMYILCVDTLPDGSGLSPTVITSYANSSVINAAWNDIDTPEFTIADGSGSDTEKFILEKCFEISFIRVNNDLQVTDPIITTATSLEISSSSQYASLIHNFKAGEEYYMSIKACWTGTDMFHGETGRQYWKSAAVVSEKFSIMDCSHANFIDTKTNEEIPQDAVLFISKQNDPATETHSIMWSEENKTVNMHACKDYDANVTCTSRSTHQVAEIKCEVADRLVIEFSGMMNSLQTPYTQASTGPWNNIGAASTAYNIKYLSATVDSGFSVSDNYINLTPYNSSDGKLVNFYIELVDDDTPLSGPGNRGDVSISRLNNHAVKIDITDNDSRGLPHSDAKTSLQRSDIYHFKVYANVIE